MSGSALIIKADARSIPLPDESVDLIITSPPYWSHRDNGHSAQVGLEASYAAFLEALWAITAECARVLKPSGSMFVNLGDRSSGSGGYNNAGVDPKSKGPRRYIKTGSRGPDQGSRQGETRTIVCHQPATMPSDVPPQSLMGLPWRYALGCVDRHRLLLRAPIIWSKNCIPKNARDRVEIRHEDVFHFAKRSPCYSNADYVHRWDSVWRIPTEPVVYPDWVGEEHSSTFPQELPRRAILGWCPPGGVVLDPFGGSGTTAMVARVLGRVGISSDLSYHRAARWRIFQSHHWEKTLNAVARENQGDLFGAPA